MWHQGASGKMSLTSSPPPPTSTAGHTAAQQPGLLPSRSCGVLPQAWLSRGPQRPFCVTAGLPQHCHLQCDSSLVPWEVEENDGLQFPEILGPNPGIVSKGTRVGSTVNPRLAFFPSCLCPLGSSGHGLMRSCLRKAWPEWPRRTPDIQQFPTGGSPGGDDYTGRPVGGGLWVCLGADLCL